MHRGVRGILTLVAASAAAALLAVPALGANAGGFSPTGSMGTARLFHAAAPLADGRVLIVGGSPDGGGTSLMSTELFDPATGTFSAGPSLGVPRKGVVAAPLQDGRVLIAGGAGESSAQIYNPATNGFAATGFMGNDREGAAAAPLPDGRVLVIGGTDDGGVSSLASSEIWDPDTNLWSPGGDMATARYAPGAAPLPDGRVLVAGGYAPGLLASAEIYDPVANDFSSAGIGSLDIPVRGLAMAPLPDGRVLATGGDEAGGGQPVLAQAFDPETLDFSTSGIAALGTPRGFHAAAPLSDGRVLVTGGAGPAGVARSAEIYASINTFAQSVQGRRLLVTVQAEGKVDVAGQAVKAAVPAKKKKKKKGKALLRPSSASGGPGTIEVPLLLTKAAKAKLRKKGKLTLPVRISFSPEGGLTSARSVKLKLKRPKKKRKK